MSVKDVCEIYKAVQMQELMQEIKKTSNSRIVDPGKEGEQLTRLEATIENYIEFETKGQEQVTIFLKQIKEIRESLQITPSAKDRISVVSQKVGIAPIAKIGNGDQISTARMTQGTTEQKRKSDPNNVGNLARTVKYPKAINVSVVNEDKTNGVKQKASEVSPGIGDRVPPPPLKAVEVDAMISKDVTEYFKKTADVWIELCQNLSANVLPKMSNGEPRKKLKDIIDRWNVKFLECKYGTS